MRKLLIFIFFIILAPVLYNLDAIYGAWKFSRLCKNEGGARIYMTVERNVGWVVENSDELSYQAPFVFQHIAFVRWKDRLGSYFDVYLDKDIQKTPYPRRSEYVFHPANVSNPVRYKYMFDRKVLSGDARIGVSQDLVVDIKTGKVAASFTQFSYRWTTPERVVLNAPTGVQCSFYSADYEKFRESIFKRGEK